MSKTGIALVSGANRGLGLATVRELAGRGMTVLLGSRDLERGRQAAARLVDEGLAVEPVRLDVTDGASVAGAADQIGAAYGRLDVLVNNAGRLADVPALEVTATDLRTTLEVNVVSAAAMIQAFLPLLRMATAPRVVNVTSTTASMTRTVAGVDFGGTGNFLDYATSKTALNMLTLQYAAAFAADPALAHVTIVAVTPGYVATDINHHRGTRSAADGARIIADYTTAEVPSGGFFNQAGPVEW